MNRAIALLLYFMSITGFAADVIRVAVSPVLSSSAIFLAYEAGYFKKHGITNIEIIPFKESGAPMTALLASNQVDIGAGNISAGLWNAMGKGANIKLVADKGHTEDDADYIALLVRRELVLSGKYKTTKDLKGLRFGLTSIEGVSQQIQLAKLLEEAGLSLKDVTLIKMSYSNMNIALKNGEIDATIQLEPYVTMAIDEKIAEKIRGAQSIYPNQQSAGIFFSSKFLGERRKEAVAFLAAYLDGIREYNKVFRNGGEQKLAITQIKKHVAINDKIDWKKIVPVGLRLDGALDSVSLKRDYEWYKKEGFVLEQLDVNSFIDRSVLEDAHRLSLGK